MTILLLITALRARSHLTTDDTFLSIFLSLGMGAAPIPDDKKKWVAWLPMIPFTLDDKKITSLSLSVNEPLITSNTFHL